MEEVEQKKQLLNTNDIVINRKIKIETSIKTLCRMLIERKYTTSSLNEIFSGLQNKINDDELLFTFVSKTVALDFKLVISVSLTVVILFKLDIWSALKNIKLNPTLILHLLIKSHFSSEGIL
jgi:hypothetical protein